LMSKPSQKAQLGCGSEDCRRVAIPPPLFWGSVRRDTDAWALLMVLLAASFGGADLGHQLGFAPWPKGGDESQPPPG
jgi:hypothetical protein